MDPRREALAIQKHFGRYHTTIGEAIVYFRFDADLSTYDRVYDEGYRRYHMGIRLPILWADQMEAVEDYAPEGRRPTQRCRLAVAARSMHEAGVSVTETHGNRLEDTSPSTVWRQDRMHDIFWYDSRFYEVSGFQIRGRLQGEDVIIGVTGIETFRDDDMVLDFPPGQVIIEPTPFAINVEPDLGNPYIYSFNVADDPDHVVDWAFGDGTTVTGVLAGDTVTHDYEQSGTFPVTAFCHQETISTDLTVAPGLGYGLGQYGIVQPYGDPPDMRPHPGWRPHGSKEEQP